MGSRTDEPVRVRFCDLVEWLRSVRGFPRDCAPPFAALVTHYGRRFDGPESQHEGALRQALVEFLDADRTLRGAFDEYLGVEDSHRHVAEAGDTAVEVDDADDLTHAVEAAKVAEAVRADDLYLEADILLLRLETKRGVVWPIQAGVGCVEVTTFRWQKGLGGEKGRRSFTEVNLVVVLGVSILMVKLSRVDAMRLTLLVLKRIGLAVGGGDKGNQASLSRAKGAVTEFLAETTGEPDLVPERVRAAYKNIADSIPERSRIAVPREPKGWTGWKVSGPDSDPDPES